MTLARLAAVTVLALFGAVQAHAATATVGFGIQGEFPPTSFSDPVFTENSRHVDTTSLLADLWGSADLRDGTVRAKMSTTPVTVYQSSPIAITSVSITDDLHVIGPGTAPVPMTMTLDVDALLPINPALGANGYESLIFRATMSALGAPGKEMRVIRSKSLDENGAVTQDDIICQWDCGLLNEPLTLAGVVNGKLMVQGMVVPNTSFTFWATVELQTFIYPVGLKAEIDASHTARVSYSLPTGYTLGSQSGVFLTAPVPEPSTTALALAGGALLVGLLRRRRLVTGAAAPRTRCD
ncbi:PEP-CTERM sorting domain-containing protein [Roseateles sp.]|uniref:PEP-CTERM sorting domain-containing protein n=1 Tax=Roseateles sp. TaxID=1971397 RepID=UPI0032656E8E